MHHAVGAGDLHLDVLDDRERDRDAELLLMFCVQARCENTLSIDRPSNSQFILKVSAALAKPMNSVVHTGVKSAGCENRISHLPL
jgi:hypothetical protein